MEGGREERDTKASGGLPESIGFAKSEGAWVGLGRVD